MKKKFIKRMLSITLAAAMAVGMIAGCGKGSKDGNQGDKDASFTWWIFQMDNAGEWYQDYKETGPAQFINQQYWDVENGGIGTEETGRKIDLSYMVPVTGSEQENFNTMISTGDYPEIIDMSAASDSPQAMCEAGQLMEIIKVYHRKIKCAKKTLFFTIRASIMDYIRTERVVRRGKKV